MSVSDITHILDLFTLSSHPELFVLKYVQLTRRYCICFVFKSDFFHI